MSSIVYYSAPVYCNIISTLLYSIVLYGYTHRIGVHYGFYLTHFYCSFGSLPYSLYLMMRAQPSAVDEAAVTAITKLIEQQLGIEDREMALSMLEIARDLNDLAAFNVAIDRDFGAPARFISVHTRSFDNAGAIDACVLVL